MKKKIYTAPALSVEEFEMSEIVCASIENFENNAGLNLSKTGGTGGARANNRDGIWDEE